MPMLYGDGVFPLTLVCTTFSIVKTSDEWFHQAKREPGSYENFPACCCCCSFFGCHSAKTQKCCRAVGKCPAHPQSRADALIKQMTLEEKISLIGGDKDAYSTHAIARLNIPKLVICRWAAGCSAIMGRPALSPALERQHQRLAVGC